MLTKANADNRAQLSRIAQAIHATEIELAQYVKQGDRLSRDEAIESLKGLRTQRDALRRIIDGKTP